MRATGPIGKLDSNQRLGCLIGIEFLDWTTRRIDDLWDLSHKFCIQLMKCFEFCLSYWFWSKFHQTQQIKQEFSCSYWGFPCTHQSHIKFYEFSYQYILSFSPQTTINFSISFIFWSFWDSHRCFLLNEVIKLGSIS